MADTLAPGGFQLDRYEESRVKFVQSWQDGFGPGSNTASDTPDGHIIDWGSGMGQSVLDKCGLAYQSGFLTTSGSVNQASQILGPLFNSFPKQATSSTGQVLAFGTVGTPIIAGSAMSTSQQGDRYLMDSTAEIEQSRWVVFVWSPALDLSSQTVVIGPQSYGPTLALEGTGLEVATNIWSFLPVQDAQIVKKYDPYEDPNGNGVLIIETSGVLSALGTATASDVETLRGSLMAVTSEEQGAIPGESLTITQINTSTTGWDGVANLASVTIGSNADSLARYIQRHLDTLGKNGTSTLVGLIGRLRDVSVNPGIEYVEIYNNPFNIPDAEGRPPHSFEVVKLGGNDLTTAQLIWENHPLGIETIGQQDFLVEDPRTNNTHLVRLTNAEELFAWVDITITPGEGFPTLETSDIQAQVATNVVALGQSRGVGQDAYTKDISASMRLTGVEACLVETGIAFSAASAKPALSAANLTVSDLQILRWDTVRITVLFA